MENRKYVVIKKYANRKLYNMETSQYVTLYDIGELLNQNREVIVIDNKTKRDITVQTLTSLLAELTERRLLAPSMSDLKALITNLTVIEKGLINES